MPDLYILAGCNGAGKTTASTIVLPEIWKCKEFVNADNIAAELCPSDPDSVAMEAGRIMLGKLDRLIREGASFSIETTLSTRSYMSLIKAARAKGYTVTLLFFWLASPEVAIDRVASRVRKGGHDIPTDIIRRRYGRGIQNLIDLYTGICNYWLVVSNMSGVPEMIAEGRFSEEIRIRDGAVWALIADQKQYFDSVEEPGMPYSGSYAERILQGIRKAVDIAIREAALKNETMVIADKEGNIKHIPAVELLKGIPG
ncbi:MAG: zeta toxin family protein [Chitinophagaceae bacterium]|nr:zeta toxin family protein [Chitinophagaceae bacterium]